MPRTPTLHRRFLRLGATALVWAVAGLLAGPLPAADDPSPPASTVKLVFIHHSTGGAWLADDNGGLATALRDNNYYVSATNYGWQPYDIGDRTDVPNWPEWFTGSESATILAALYAETGQNFGGFGDWSRLDTDPGGENTVILFKSCFPNSDIWGEPDDPPAEEPSGDFTVANFKAVYNNILTYFASRQDKLFVAIAAPPLISDDTEPERAANARAFNNWLRTEWLAGYPYRNVAVFDFYNVLTSNGGSADVSDAGWATGNHHRWRNGAVQYQQTVDNNFCAYPSGDSHPSQAGNLKATAEFVPLLNVFYHRWQAGTTPLQYGELAGYLAENDPLPAGKSGDVNGDGRVDALDLVWILTH